jgi:pimeloyl-ACP methyl ester carboxylesterase
VFAFRTNSPPLSPQKDKNVNSNASQPITEDTEIKTDVQVQQAPDLKVRLRRWKLKDSEKPSFKRMAAIEAVKLSILFFILSPVCLFQLTRILLFFPDQTAYDMKAPLATIADKLKTKVEAVKFKSANGKMLNGLYFNRQGSKRVFLLSHGNAGNVAHRIPHVIHMLQLGASVLLYDYQGYGKSEGDPSVSGIVDDGIAAYDYLTKQLGWHADQVVLYGESLGCSVTCQIAKQRPAAALVLQSGFASLPGAARDRFIWLNLFPDFTFPQPQLNNCQILRSSKIPLLIIHGEKDNILPIKYADQMYAAASSPKQFVRLKNSGHNDVLEADLKDYVAALTSLFKQLDQGV